MFDVTFGQVTMHIPKGKPRKIANGIPAIKWWLPDWTPIYVHRCTHYLSYSVNGNYHKVYNPDGFRFDLEALISRIVEYHLRYDNWQVTDFRVLRQTS